MWDTAANMNTLPSIDHFEKASKIRDQANQEGTMPFGVLSNLDLIKRQSMGLKVANPKNTSTNVGVESAAASNSSGQQAL